MNKNFFETATEIYKNKKEYKVLAVRLVDKSSMNQSIGLVVESSDGRWSEIKRVKKSGLKSGNILNFLLDMEGSFDFEDVNNTRSRLIEKYSALEELDVTEKVDIQTIIKEIIQYAKERLQLHTDEGYIDIEKKKFQEMVSEQDWGYSKLELLKVLKAYGILRANKGRNYDWALTNEDGYQYRVISVLTFDENKEVA